MHLALANQFSVSDIQAGDKPAFIEYLAVKQISDQTLAIPYPYTETDADWWIGHLAEVKKKVGRSVNWGIRNETGRLIGGIGFHDLEPGKTHRAEIGYWLAEPYWGHGIMTDAVKRVTDYGFREFGLIRITASVFDFNFGSAAVLKKAGYQQEGVLRKHYQKNGGLFDGILFAKLADVA